MLVDPSSGKALSQKRYPRMALIKPSIDLERGVLTVKAKGMEDLVLPLLELAGFGTPPLSSTSSDGDSIDLDPQSTLLCGELVNSSKMLHSPIEGSQFSSISPSYSASALTARNDTSPCSLRLYTFVTVD